MGCGVPRVWPGTLASMDAAVKCLLYSLVPGLGDAWGQPNRTGPLDSVAKDLGSHLLQVESPGLAWCQMWGGIPRGAPRP